MSFDLRNVGDVTEKMLILNYLSEPMTAESSFEIDRHCQTEINAIPS
jgi:hypothetical protein